jgi:hypothetical protein
MPKNKYTYEDILIEFQKRDFILLESEYKGYTFHHKYICENGHEASITIKNLLKGRGCKKCAAQRSANAQRKSIEEVGLIFEQNGCILLTSDYKNSKQKLKYICVCGNIDYKDLTHFLRGQRCNLCKNLKLREANLKYSIADVRKIFEENGCVLLEDGYKDIIAPMKYICECGRESKISLINLQKGTRCRQCYIERNKGENHFNYNVFLTDEEREHNRKIEGYNQWRNLVFERDNYTCQVCGDNSGGNLVAHHLNGYHWCKELRIDVINGITLCKDCHIIKENSFHKIMGFKNNSIDQFLVWFEDYTGLKFNLNLLGESYETLFYFCKQLKEVG